jgi:hypothetical protein
MSVAALKREEIERTQKREVAPTVPEMVERYLNGESMQVLGKECGKGRRTIYKWMFSEVGGEKFREVVTECLINRMADADDALEAAVVAGADAATISGRREMCRFARMDFERRRPALYGVKQDVGAGPAVIIQIANLRGGEVEIKAPLALQEPDTPG